MSPPRCPICDKPVDPDQATAAPFCSERCRGVDLGRWLGEQYGLPYESEDQPEQPLDNAEDY